MDGLSALPWTARWCQGTLPCPQSVDKRCRRSHGQVERLAMDGPLVSRYLTLTPLDPNPSIRGVGAPMDGLSALPWTARWCQGTLPCFSYLDSFGLWLCRAMSLCPAETDSHLRHLGFD